MTQTAPINEIGTEHYNILVSKADDQIAYVCKSGNDHLNAANYNLLCRNASQLILYIACMIISFI